MTRIVAMETEQGEILYMRGNPSEEDVKKFVAHQNNRFARGHIGGPSGIDPHKINQAYFLENEMERFNPEAEKIKIDISDIVN